VLSTTMHEGNWVNVWKNGSWWREMLTQVYRLLGTYQSCIYV